MSSRRNLYWQFLEFITEMELTPTCDIAEDMEIDKNKIGRYIVQAESNGIRFVKLYTGSQLTHIRVWEHSTDLLYMLRDEKQ